MYSFRFDISDVANGGLECFLNGAGEKLSGDNGILEDLVMEFQYRDIHGWNRKVTIPVILSAYGSLALAEPDATIMGFAQRGDTIAFQGYFPEFESINQVSLYLGKGARELCSNNGILIDENKLTTRQRSAYHFSGSDE